MKTIRISYKNGNTLDQKCYDWMIKDNHLWYTTRVGVEMAHPACIKMDNIVKVEEIQEKCNEYDDARR